MLPDPWPALVLALAAYRLVRLGGWDDWPPIYRLRAWVIGERWITNPYDALAEREATPPWKQPSSEADHVHVYDRPLLAHLVHCPFCLGWWVSLAVYGAWLLQPTVALYAAAPLALSGFVGLVSKNLDA